MSVRQALLGTSAMVAGGVAAGAANADDGVNLELGGRYAAAAGWNIQEDFYPGAGIEGAPRAVAFRQDVEVFFLGETTLDNGLRVGAHIRLEGQQSGDQMDEVWAFFNGGFGEIRFGDDEDAAEQLAYGIPTATNIFGVDSPYFSFSNAWASGLGLGTGFTYLKMSDNATKIIYFAPTFGGFTFALSYAPDRRGEDCYFGFTSGTACGSSAPGGTTYANNRGQMSEVVSGALNYEGDFDSFTLFAGVGGSYGEWERPGFVTDGVTTTYGDTTAWGIRGHLQAAIGNWYIGGSMVYRKNGFYAGSTPSQGEEVNLLFGGLGVTYNWDAWTVGTSWAHGNIDNWGGKGQDATLDIIRIEGRYDLAPGISLDASTGWDSWDADSQPDYSAWSFATGFYIAF